MHPSSFFRFCPSCGTARDPLQKPPLTCPSCKFTYYMSTTCATTINSRRVYITGAIAKPGPYPLTVGMRVTQLIAIAGGPSGE